MGLYQAAARRIKSVTATVKNRSNHIHVVGGSGSGKRQKQFKDNKMLRTFLAVAVIHFALPLEFLSGYDFSHDTEGWRASSIGGAPGGASQSFSDASAVLWASPDGTLVVDPAGVHDGRVAVIDSPQGAFVPLADDVFAVLRLRTRS